MSTRAVSLVASPVTTVGQRPDGAAVTVLGQPPDTAAADHGYVFVSDFAGGSVMVKVLANWYSLAPCQSKFSVSTLRTFTGTNVWVKDLVTGQTWIVYSGTYLLVGTRHLMVTKVVRR